MFNYSSCFKRAIIVLSETLRRRWLESQNNIVENVLCSWLLLTKDIFNNIAELFHHELNYNYLLRIFQIIDPEIGSNLWIFNIGIVLLNCDQSWWNVSLLVKERFFSSQSMFTSWTFLTCTYYTVFYSMELWNRLNVFTVS